MAKSDIFYQKMKELNLSEQPAWTISTIKKQPLAPKPALKHHFNPETFQEWFEFAKDPEHTLVTLTDLYNEPNTPLNLTALHVNIDKQKVMLIDMETEYDQRVNPYLKQLPVAYGEQSIHGGQHYIVPVSDAILNDLKYSNLFQKTQVKFGEIKDQEHTGVEIFFHNHYLTFTHNYLPVNQNNTDENLRNVLDFIIEKTKPKAYEKHAFINDDEQIPRDATIIGNAILTNPKAMQYLKPKIEANEDIANNSTREFHNMLRIGATIKYQESRNYKYCSIDPEELEHPEMVHQLSLLTWVLFYLSQKLMPPRDKWHKTVTQGQSYLKYTSNKVISSIYKK